MPELRRTTWMPLYRAHWELIVAALGERMTKATERITAALKEFDGVIVSVQGQTPGWRQVADLIAEDEKLSDVAKVIRFHCAAADLEDW